MTHEGTTTSSLLGRPVFAEPWLSVSDARRVRQPVPIKQQLRTFLTAQVDGWKPERIIVIERKGTAILRSLIEAKEDPIELDWDRVVSSSVLEQVRNEWIQGKRVLIFDGIMRHGHSVSAVLEELERRQLWQPGADNIRIAMFAVHEHSSRGLRYKNELIPYEWFFRDLDDTGCRRVRFDIVELLQNSGSLMLDTEHIEVRVRLRTSIARFLEAVRRRANAVVFHSGKRTNVTIHYGNDKAHELDQDGFPPGTRVKEIVKKCRIVERDVDELAIIPICYPAVPEFADDWPTKREHLELLGASVAESGRAQFYGSALLGAMQVLKWVLTDLAAADPAQFTVSLPASPSAERSADAYTLEHLSVMHPTLDVDKLTRRIHAIQNESQSKGNLLRRRKQEPRQTPRYLDDELAESARQLLQVIRHVIDGRLLDERDDSTVPSGLRAAEVFAIGRRFGWEDVKTSTLFDILIDQADLVTHAEKVCDEGKRIFARTFEPDGEIVSELIRRFTTQWGLPQGF